MTVDKLRQDAQPAFVLHTYPYLETSLLVETFTRNLGRVPLVAKGAKRPKSALRGLLVAFQPLHLTWSGKSELRTLHKAEWQSGQQPLQGMALICGFYLNELLIRLLHRDDPHKRLFDYYQETLSALNAQQDYFPILRHFEKCMLVELGYALVLNEDVASGKPINLDENYYYEIERGPIRANGNDNSPYPQLRGKTLLDMERNDYSDIVTRKQSKILMRYIFRHYLGEQPLYSRQLLRIM
ncbi:MAG: DNA repair protein RecO [Nitrosomonadaceae bacterium]|nr:DNA repair protein RecO [Nitrosomonadaceae bacterium]|tara:strand:- start:224 stop:943 length:720 start_codon:yes stop_codon:yes gene_type:complete